MYKLVISLTIFLISEIFIHLPRYFSVTLFALISIYLFILFISMEFTIKQLLADKEWCEKKVININGQNSSAFPECYEQDFLLFNHRRHHHCYSIHIGMDIHNHK